MKKTIVLLFSLLLLMGAQSSFAQCSISGPSPITVGDVENYSTTGNSSYTYFWSVTGVLSIVGSNSNSNVNVTSNTTGDGTVCVTRFKAGEEPCCECKDIKVEEPPCTPATSITVSQIEVPGNGCPGDIIQFVANIQPSDADIEPNSFFWQAGTDFIISNPFFQQSGGSIMSIDTPEGENSVWIKVTFTSCDGTTVTALTLVTWEISCFRSGITPPFLNVNPNSSIAPNPFSDFTQLNIDVEKEVAAEVEIFNISGQVIYTKSAQLYKGKNEIIIDDIPNDYKGVLYYRIKSNSEVLGYGEMLRVD